MTTRVHPTAIVEDRVQLGDGTSVWDHAHIRHGTVIGRHCIIGGKTYIAYDVRIGDYCKINASVYICTAVTIEDGVMVAAGTIFTNDRFPRAATPELDGLRSSDPNEETQTTRVRSGATIGAGCIIGSNLEIGQWAMVGMGSVITRSVPDFHLVIGQPARSLGAVCRCGNLLCHFHQSDVHQSDLAQAELVCSQCARKYAQRGMAIQELTP
jgi:acetyltransferase-like isoleucine patch superfamily enzyme